MSPNHFVRCNPIPGWTLSPSDSGDAGTFNPPTTAFPAIPEGQNTAYLGGSDSEPPTAISQVLPLTLAPGTYTLRVDVGDRLDINFAGYRVQLLAGGVLLAEDNNTLTPANGQFVTSTVTFTALPGDSRLGTPLQIRLSAINQASRQTNFDNVRLEVLPANQPPMANAGPDQSVQRGATVILDGSGSFDPHGDTPLQFAWTFAQTPAGSAATLTGADTSMPSFTADVAGDYTIRLMVTDALGAMSAPDEVLVSTINAKPVAAAGPD